MKGVARPEYWIPDHEISQCQCCTKTFTPSMSKHHCRACGQGVCSKCSTKTRPVPSRGWDHPVRVCDSCADRTDPLWFFHALQSPPYLCSTDKPFIYSSFLVQLLLGVQNRFEGKPVTLWRLKLSMKLMQDMTTKNQVLTRVGYCWHWDYCMCIYNVKKIFPKITFIILKQYNLCHWILSYNSCYMFTCIDPSKIIFESCAYRKYLYVVIV